MCCLFVYIYWGKTLDGALKSPPVSNHVLNKPSDAVSHMPAAKPRGGPFMCRYVQRKYFSLHCKARGPFACSPTSMFTCVFAYIGYWKFFWITFLSTQFVFHKYGNTQNTPHLPTHIASKPQKGLTKERGRAGICTTDCDLSRQLDGAVCVLQLSMPAYWILWQCCVLCVHRADILPTVCSPLTPQTTIRLNPLLYFYSLFLFPLMWWCNRKPYKCHMVIIFPHVYCCWT